MTKDVRNQILIILKQHDDGPSSSTYKDDKDIPSELGKSVKEIQDQLEILEMEDKVDLVKTMGPTFGARITPLGRKHLEDIS